MITLNAAILWSWGSSLGNMAFCFICFPGGFDGSSHLASSVSSLVIFQVFGDFHIQTFLSSQSCKSCLFADK